MSLSRLELLKWSSTYTDSIIDCIKSHKPSALKDGLRPTLYKYLKPQDEFEVAAIDVVHLHFIFNWKLSEMELPPLSDYLSKLIAYSLFKRGFVDE